jgi:hypothetical protein
MYKAAHMAESHHLAILQGWRGSGDEGAWVTSGGSGLLFYILRTPEKVKSREFFPGSFLPK